MNLIFFGPPGSGKGTYASRIGPQLGIPHISTGDIFRSAIAEQSKLGRKVQAAVKAGRLVDDDTTNAIVKERLARQDAKKGFILDGYPRTVKQAGFLDRLTHVGIVINLELSEDIIIEKALARRICEKCGNIYNIADINRRGIRMPPLLPKKQGVCDKCGGRLIHRKDDNEATIRDRLETYRQQSEPLIAYYRKKKLVKDVRVVGPPEVMVPRIMKILKAVEK